VDFAGVMTAATVTINGHKLGEYRGGYTPFSFELTPHLRSDAPNVLAVEVDSTERPDIPPFGGNIDYLTFGGIYREVALRIVPAVFIENVFAKPVDVLGDGRRVEVKCPLQGESANPLTLKVELRDGDRVLSSVEGPPSAPPLILSKVGAIDLWDLDRPKLYTVTARLYQGGAPIDEYSTRIGFREARFTPQGFMLNGKHIKLRGLNRHQTFPFVGGAMPARAQQRDALILKRELKCNIVRTSHYPQSPYFLDACDEIGLLVFEEIPGWQHIGDQAWQDLAVRNVEQMIRRDWNHPSIVLWGVRINESQDDHAFYTRTNALAHELDNSRQTGGVRYLYDSELLEDVMTMNDFGFPLRPPNHPLYLNTEFNGHMFPTKRNDNVDRVMEHALRHARVHNQLASDDRYAGGIGWCAFDYNTHANFGSGDKICYHGVTDIFRILKPAGQFYRSQCDPKEEVVLEPCFNWSQGDQSEGGGIRHAVIVSNCDHLKIHVKRRSEGGGRARPRALRALAVSALRGYLEWRAPGGLGRPAHRRLHQGRAGDLEDPAGQRLRPAVTCGAGRRAPGGRRHRCHARSAARDQRTRRRAALFDRYDFAASGGAGRNRGRESVFARRRSRSSVGSQQGSAGDHPAACAASVFGGKDRRDPGDAGRARTGVGYDELTPEEREYSELLTVLIEAFEDANYASKDRRPTAGCAA
jgi:beta-galactosidase